MAHETMADKMAKKALATPEFRRQWRVHTNSFGPLLEKMFEEDAPSRVWLMAALNNLSGREFDAALRELQKLAKAAKTDADACGLHFFQAFAYQLQGKKLQAGQHYRQCVELKPDFYLPYLRLGIQNYLERDYGAADVLIQQALECFDRADQGKEAKSGLLKCLYNHSRVLVTIHRYRDAIAAADRAEQLQGKASFLAGESRAMAYAALGEAEACHRELEALGNDTEVMGKLTEQILAGKDSHYAVFGIREDYIPQFWDWFCGNEEKLRQVLDGAGEIAEHIKPLFPEFDFDPQVSLTGTRVTIRDWYNASLGEGYRLLLEAAPGSLCPVWSFEQVR